MMCIAVSTACDEKVASSAAICGGLLCAGRISSVSLRRTTARAMTTQIQKPARSHKGLREVEDVESCCECFCMVFTRYRQEAPVPFRPFASGVAGVVLINI